MKAFFFLIRKPVEQSYSLLLQRGLVHLVINRNRMCKSSPYWQGYAFMKNYIIKVACISFLLGFLTCVVKCEEKQEHSHKHITQKGDNSTGNSFWNGVDRFHKELEEYWNAAVEKYTQQNAGCVQCSCKRNTNSC